MMLPENATVAVCRTPEEAQRAVKELERAGFDLKLLSVVGMDPQTNGEVVGYYREGDRMKYWGKQSGFWNSFWSMISGWAFFSIPGIGPVLVVGPLAKWMVAALDNAAIFGTFGALAATLYSIGIPKARAQECEAALKNDNLLVIAHGPASEVTQARMILRSATAEQSVR
jgi:hypothetical protein